MIPKNKEDVGSQERFKNIRWNGYNNELLKIGKIERKTILSILKALT